MSSGALPLHLDEDRCLDLLHGLLDPDEVEAIVSHLEECPACESLLRQRAGEREFLRARRPTPAAASPPSLDSVMATPSQVRRLPRIVWAVAALLVLAAGLTTWSMRAPRHAGTSLPALAWLPPASDPVVTRDPAPTPSDAPIRAGLEAYERHDAATAARLLGAATAQGEMEIVRRLYWSSALAWNGEHAAALVALRGVRIDPLPEPWRGEALWTQYVGLRGTGQQAAADSLWRELADRDDAIGTRARAVGPAISPPAR